MRLCQLEEPLRLLEPAVRLSQMWRQAQTEQQPQEPEHSPAQEQPQSALPAWRLQTRQQAEQRQPPVWFQAEQPEASLQPDQPGAWLRWLESVEGAPPPPAQAGAEEQFCAEPVWLLPREELPAPAE